MDHLPTGWMAKQCLMAMKVMMRWTMSQLEQYLCLPEGWMAKQAA